jgi:hypothetical protein
VGDRVAGGQAPRTGAAKLQGRSVGRQFRVFAVGRRGLVIDREHLPHAEKGLLRTAAMRVFDLLDRLVEKKAFHIGYLLVLTLSIMTYLNGCWINESLTWTPHGWLKKENYWQFYEPTTLIYLMHLLLPYSAYVLKKWCAECYLMAVICTALFWPVLLVNFAIAEAWGKYKKMRKRIPSQSGMATT